LGGAQPLQKGAYLRRWARRLRNFSFSAEDAIIVAYGSFGTDPDRGSVGVDLIVTTDKKLATRYGEGYVDVEKRFNNMIWNLPPPYSAAKLPLRRKASPCYRYCDASLLLG
jgi:hypothetical protein